MAQGLAIFKSGISGSSACLVSDLHPQSTTHSGIEPAVPQTAPVALYLWPGLLSAYGSLSHRH